ALRRRRRSWNRHRRRKGTRTARIFLGRALLFDNARKSSRTGLQFHTRERRGRCERSERRGWRYRRRRDLQRIDQFELLGDEEQVDEFFRILLGSATNEIRKGVGARHEPAHEFQVLLVKVKAGHGRVRGELEPVVAHFGKGGIYMYGCGLSLNAA